MIPQSDIRSEDIRLTRTLKLTGRIARYDIAIHASSADIDALTRLLRIIVVIALRDALAFRVSLSGLLLRTRREADC